MFGIKSEKSIMSDKEKIPNDWCRDFVEVLIKERSKSFDSWATRLVDVFVDLNELSAGRVVYREEGQETLERKEYVIDFYYQKNDSGNTKDFYFTLTESEYDVFKKANSGVILDEIRFLRMLSSFLTKGGKQEDSLELNWVHSQILIRTPNLKFKSKEQIKLLKSKIEQVAVSLKRREILERFQNLIEYKSEIVGGGAHKDITPIKSNNPADVIRSIKIDIQNFNNLYEHREYVGDINLWINYIFLDEPGFSLNHIQKASQRGK